jgi:CRISPR system Cascade subunit CasD
MAALVMRWRGPLMSLAGARIDGYAQQMPIPSLTMVAGLLGAALGYRRGDERLPILADSLRYGVVVHRPGTPLVDFQTADLANHWHGVRRGGPARSVTPLPAGR